MSPVLEAIAREPAAGQARLVVYVDRDMAARLERVIADARRAGRLLSLSALAREAFGRLLEEVECPAP